MVIRFWTSRCVSEYLRTVTYLWSTCASSRDHLQLVPNIDLAPECMLYVSHFEGQGTGRGRGRPLPIGEGGDGSTLALLRNVTA